MTVRITKPELNIREQLRKLEYSHIPYEKLPAGVPIQTVVSRYQIGGTANEHETNSNTYQATPFSVTIKPRFTSSLIEVKAVVNHKENGSTAYHNVAIYRQIEGESDFSYIGDSTSNGQMTISWGSSSAGNTIYGAVPILIFDNPGTILPVTYKIYHRHSQGSYTVRIGENGADEYMSATEIRGQYSSISKY